MAKSRAKRTKKTQKQTASKPTIWQALNEPVVEVSEEFARGILLTAILIIMMAWVLPYWGSSSALAAEYPFQTEVISYQNQPSEVAGQQTTALPDWYYLVQRISSDITLEFGQAAYDVLDISDPVQESIEFYKPGVQAFWDAWLELMADPIYY